MKFDEAAKSYEEIYNKPKRIGLFPGKFKPPHIGHFNTVKAILGKYEGDFDVIDKNLVSQNICDEVILFISEASLRESIEITPEISMEIWKLFLNSTGFQDKVSIKITHPVKGVTGFLDGVGSNGRYNGTPVDDLEFILFAGKEDIEDKRFEWLFRNQNDLLNTDEQLLKICPLNRITSSTAIRSDILEISIDAKDTATLQSNIPPHVDVDDYWHILSKTVESK